MATPGVVENGFDADNGANGENGESESSSESSESEEDLTWISWFINLRGNEFFVAIDETTLK